MATCPPEDSYERQKVWDVTTRGNMSYCSYSHFALTVGGLLNLALVLAIAGVVPVYAQTPHRVGLVVAHDGITITRCIEFHEEQISGYDVLERSGLALIPMAGSAMGVSICSLDNRGCNYPAEDCFCQCQATPCIYWSYWHMIDGQWQYSSLGASNYWVRHGDVEGWVWSEGEYGQSGQPPPMLRFEEICPAVSSSEPSIDCPADAPSEWWIAAGTVAAAGALSGVLRLWRLGRHRG
ncbi:MAG: hypothetical protein ACUVSF_11505 [Anaerolineae bacterium]